MLRRLGRCAHRPTHAATAPSPWRAARTPGRCRSHSPRRAAARAGRGSRCATRAGPAQPAPRRPVPAPAPRWLLVAPHERCFHRQGPIHPQAQRHLQRLERVVAAVGVAGIVGLRHATHQHVQPAPVGQRRPQREEQQVAPGHEGVGQPVGLHGNGDVVGHGTRAELAKHVYIQEVVIAQVTGPRHGQQALAQARTAVELHAVALAVVKAQRLHMGVARQGPGQARGGILSSRKEDQRAPAHATAGAGGVRMARTMAASITP